MRFWFAQLRSGIFNLANKSCGRPKCKAINDVLQAVVEVDPSQSTEN